MWAGGGGEGGGGGRFKKNSTDSRGPGSFKEFVFAAEKCNNDCDNTFCVQQNPQAVAGRIKKYFFQNRNLPPKEEDFKKVVYSF